MNFREEIFKSIQGMVDKCIGNYKSDHTYQSIIKRITPKGYVVLDESGQERTAKCCIPGVGLKIGDSVLVKIPNGNLKQLHIVGVSGKTTATTTATKVGSSTVGSTKNPIYLNKGIATACNTTIGNTKKPVYMNNGEIATCDATVGNHSKPVYLNNGEITACSSSMITYSDTEPLDLNFGATWIDA